MVYTPVGPAFVGKNISIQQYLQERAAQAAADDDFDSNSKPAPLLQLLVTPPVAQAATRPPSISSSDLPLTRKQKKASKARLRRSKKRAERQLQAGTGLKAVTIKKRLPLSTKDALKLPLNIESCGAATGPGWVGRPLQDLPRSAFTLEGLKRAYGVVCFDWDGVYVLKFSATDFYSQHAQNDSPLA